MKLFRVIDKKTGREADIINEKGELVDASCLGDVKFYCDLIGWAIQEDGTLIVCDACGNFAYPPEGRFEVHWGTPKIEEINLREKIEGILRESESKIADIIKDVHFGAFGFLYKGFAEKAAKAIVDAVCIASKEPAK